MNDYALAQILAYGPIAVAAILVWWGMLRWLDRLGRIVFSRDIMPKLAKTGIGSGIYFGARCIAVALVVAAVFGAVRF
jgi:hypothetical protein